MLECSPLNTSRVISGVYRRKLFTTRLNLGKFGDSDVLFYDVFIMKVMVYYMGLECR